jgi:creatinine amidohydrolase
MLLSEVTWMEVEEYLTREDRLILTVGSCEQHGRHLTFVTDTMIPWELARRLAERTGVAAAPPLAYGMSLHHMKFPGTLSLKPATLVAVLTDLLECAHQHGFRRILVVNGHGGNGPSLAAVGSDACNRLPGLRLKVTSWWEQPSVAKLVEKRFGGREAHASAAETSAMLALEPEIVRQERAQYSKAVESCLYPSAEEFRARYPHGCAGLDPRLARAEIGEELLAAAEAELERELNGTW